VTVTLEHMQGQWHVTGSESELLSVQGAEPCEAIVEAVQPHERLTQKWLDQPIGRVKGDMTITDPMAIRLKDNALI